MPAFIQNALADEHYFLDAMYNDLIIRTGSSNQNILLDWAATCCQNYECLTTGFVNTRLRA